MQLALRKEKILAAVVESYISNGEPVGSKALQTELQINVSSATIRNELAELTEHGFLVQPHTSAGRIPTDAGYRYYVDNLLKRKQLAPSAKERIYSRLCTNTESPESVLKAASKLIADVTGAVAFSTTPDGRASRVHKLRFVPIGRHTAMAVLITSAGMVKTGLIRCEFVITADMLQVFEKALNEKLSGLPLIELTPPFIQTIAASFGELALFMPNVLEAIRSLANSAAVSSVGIDGKMNLFHMHEIGIENSVSVLRFLNNGGIGRLLSEKFRSNSVIIGSESGIKDLSSVSLIISHYEISGQKAGVIAALGSKRMDYSARIPLVEYVTQISTRLINGLVSEN